MFARDGYTTPFDVATAAIAAGASLSGAIALGGLRLFSIALPDAWTAANLTFQASYDNGTTWKDVYKDGAEYVVTAAVGKDVDVDITRFSSIPMLKVRSGTALTPVNQAAARSLQLVLRSV